MTTMNEIKTGVRRFRTKVFPLHKEFFERLGVQQTPSILFITCIDSRVEPSLLCDTSPGDMFEERTPGNIIPPYELDSSGLAASIEFAVNKEELTDIVICGHSDCGALRGALNPDGLDKMPAVMKWLEHSIQLAKQVKREFPKAKEPVQLQKLCELNVLAQMATLKSHPSVKAKKPRIHGWTYEIHTGEVKAYDPSRKEFRIWPA